MDIKRLFSSTLPQIPEVEEISTNLSNSLDLNCDMSVNISTKTDALEAVKLDPAVLEAQVTVHEKPKDVVVNKKDDLPCVDKERTPKSLKSFEEMISQNEAALLSLTPYQFDLLMKYADILRRQRNHTQKYFECAFCKNNGRSSSWYTSHVLKDDRGRVQCPVLRRYRCPRCGATGDNAHTIKYCHENSFIDTMSSYSGSLF